MIASGIALDPMELLAEFAVSHDFLDEFDLILFLKKSMVKGVIEDLSLQNYFIKFMKKHQIHVEEVM